MFVKKNETKHNNRKYENFTHFRLVDILFERRTQSRIVDRLYTVVYCVYAYAQNFINFLFFFLNQIIIVNYIVKLFLEGNSTTLIIGKIFHEKFYEPKENRFFCVVHFKREK